MTSFRMTFEFIQIEKHQTSEIERINTGRSPPAEKCSEIQKITVCTSFIASRNQNKSIHPKTSRILALFNCRYDDSSSSSINSIFRIDGVCWSNEIKSILHWQTHSQHAEQRTSEQTSKRHQLKKNSQVKNVIVMGDIDIGNFILSTKKKLPKTPTDRIHFMLDSKKKLYLMLNHNFSISSVKKL